MYSILDLGVVICCGIFIFITIAVFYYLLVLKEKGQIKTRQLQDYFDELLGVKKVKKSSPKQEEKKPEAEDAEFREVKK